MSDVFGRVPDGRPVLSHRLTGPAGLQVQVVELGAVITALHLPTRHGPRNVVLGYRDVATYLGSQDYLGAVVGRHANRIAGGRFSVGDVTYDVPRNDRGNSLHGGPEGFHSRLWRTRSVSGTAVELELVDPAGHQGYPGRLVTTVRYDVGERDVTIRLTATTDAVTPVNLTNHTYFNLDGEGTGTVDQHRVEVFADRYLPTDPVGIPLGPLRPVDGTPFDLRTPTVLSTRTSSTDPEIRDVGGIDHTFVVRGSGMRPAVTLESRDRGTSLTVLTDQPGVQIYTGNSLDGSRRGSAGRVYERGAGIALETQRFPDAPNQPTFPSTLLHPGEQLVATTTWVFDGSDLQATGAASPESASGP